MKALRGLISRLAVIAAILAMNSGAVADLIPYNMVSGAVRPADLAEAILGCTARIEDVRFTGDRLQAGLFTGGGGGWTSGGIWQKGIGMASGIIISSGKISSVAGDNSGAPGSDTMTPDRSDSDLEALYLAPAATHNAAVLEIEFTPSSTYVAFDLVFASEEYNEFANPITNDYSVFGIYVNGVNIAAVPGTSDPINVKYINGGNPIGTGPVNSWFFYDNVPATRFWAFQTAMDGFTDVFNVCQAVTPGTRNRLKIAIANGRLSAPNAAVFIRMPLVLQAACSAAAAAAAASASSASASLATPLSAYPNPYRAGSGGVNDAASITILGVPAGGTVRIYSSSGLLVGELVDGDGDGRVSWNARSSSGKPVASGIYLYAAQAGKGLVKRGKVAIIR